jgi:hypothetical protein
VYFCDVREHDREDALIENGFKLVTMRDGTMELFDLTNDPGEQHNLASSGGDRAEAMMRKILTRRRENNQRQAAGLFSLEGNQKELTEEEKKELEKKLKSLGYIQ